MAHQENPKIRFLSIRCSQELYRKVERKADARKMDLSAFVRSLLVEATRDIELTQSDSRIIQNRISERSRKVQ